MAFLEETEFCFFHKFLVLKLDLFNLLGVPSLEQLNLNAYIFIPLDLILNLVLVLLPQLAHLLIIPLPLIIEPLSELIILLSAILYIGVLDFLISLQRYLVLLLQSLHFLTIYNIQFFLLKFQLLLGPEDLEL